MKNKIKNILLVMLVAVISSALTSFLTTNSLSGNKILGSVSHSDYLDSSNVTYLNSNVQDSIDSLYTQANDYSSINTRVNTLEGYFKNNPSSEFSYNSLSLGINTTSGYGQLNVYRDGVPRGLIWANDNGMGVSARDSEGTAHVGMLDLRGNPVTINGEKLAVVKYKDVTFSTYAITTQSAQGVYYGAGISSGLTSSNVILSVSIVEWGNVKYTIVPTFNTSRQLNLISQNSQTVGSVKVRVVYI